MKKQQLIQLIKEEVQKALLEDNKILTPRRLEGRWDKKIQDYIKNGCVGDLNLEGAQITELSPNLKKVGGSLDLINSKITKLPDDLQVDDGLYLDDAPIAELPKRLKVGRTLSASNTKITKLPDNLQVGGNLWLGGTPITELPKGLKVGGYIDISDTPLSKKYSPDQIKKMIQDLGGTVRGGILIQ